MNKGGTTLYIGITNDLHRRVGEHQEGAGSEFARTYHVSRLVYFEAFRDVREALLREKQIKGWKRCRKEVLIQSVNPKLCDLSDEAARCMAEPY